MTGSRIFGNVHYGIYAPYVPVTLTGNTIYSNEYGIYSDAYAGGTETISNNLLYDHRVAAIRLTQYGPGAYEIFNNTIYEATAGWDPHGMSRFFAKMDAMDSRGNTPTFLLTHPDPEERVENVEKHIAEMGQVPTETGRERYAQLLQRLGGPAGAK